MCMYICVCIYIIYIYIYISIYISILCRAVAFIITFSPWMGGNGNPMFNMGFFSCFSHTRLKINYGGYWVKFFLDWIAVKTKQATLDASSILLVPTPVSPLCYQHSSVLPWEGQTSCVKLPMCSQLPGRAAVCEGRVSVPARELCSTWLGWIYEICFLLGKQIVVTCLGLLTLCLDKWPPGEGALSSLMVNILMACYQGTFFPGTNTQKNPCLNCFSGWNWHCMVARCAGGSPGSGEEEEVHFCHWEGKKLLVWLYLLCFS